MIKIMKTDQFHIDLIVRYLSGDITHDETIKLESWMEERTANRKLFNEYKSVWESLGKVSDTAEIDVNNEWNILKGKLTNFDKGRTLKHKPLAR